MPLIIVVMIVVVGLTKDWLYLTGLRKGEESKLLRLNTVYGNTSKQKSAALDHFEVWLDRWGPIMKNLSEKQKSKV